MKMKDFRRSFYVFALSCVCLMIVGGCGNQTKTRTELKNVIDNPNAYVDKQCTFENVVIAGKTQSKGSRAFTAIEDPYGDLTKKRYVLIKVNKDEFENFHVGNVLNIDGKLCKAEKNGNSFFFINPNGITKVELPQIASVTRSSSNDDDIDFLLSMIIMMNTMSIMNM